MVTTQVRGFGVQGSGQKGDFGIVLVFVLTQPAILIMRYEHRRRRRRAVLEPRTLNPFSLSCRRIEHKWDFDGRQIG